MRQCGIKGLGRAFASRFGAALVLFAASSAVTAQTVPTEWNSKIWGVGGSTCTSCHLTPPKISPAINDTRSVSQTLEGRLGTYLNTIPDFDAHMQTKKVNTAMTAFADTGTPTEHDLVRKYLLDIRDAHVEPSSPELADGSIALDVPIAFGTITIGGVPSQATQVITITNMRFRDITYSPIGAIGSGYSVSAESCAGRVVRGSLNSGNIAGSSCTITIRFQPTLVTDGGARTVSLAFVNDGIDPTPPTRSIRLSGFANAAPVANAGPDQNFVLRGATAQLDGSASADANTGETATLTYLWTLPTRPATSVATITSPTSKTPTLVLDKVGTYVASLVVTDSHGVSSAADTVNIIAVNNPPVANAGSNQTVARGATVTLQGSGSDADGDPLTFAWTLPTRPATSTAVLSNANTPTPTFVADKVGDYIASLKVNDTHVDSAPSTVTITVPNTAPTANAGPDQSVVTGQPVTLNGGASSDPDGDTLTYQWTMTSKPAGSAAALANATTVTPSFTPDLAGDYVSSLVVRDSHNAFSTNLAQVRVTASVANAAPVANAGPAQNVTTGATVTLDGSASSDANNDPLTFAWTLTSKPAGSAATLNGANTAKPTFVADLAGAYVASLVVNDGTVNSSNSATVTITAAVGNSAPVANAGPAQNVTTGATVTLDGSASSDANNDPLTFAWTLSAPAGSAAVLSSATAVKPTFVADVAGPYVASLVVNDGTVNSAASNVTITAVAGNAAPVANAGPAQSVATGASVTLDGSASSDANGDALTYQWSFSSKPAGSAAVLSSATAVKPTFTADLAGSYIARLVVNDGQVDSSPATVTVTASLTTPVFSINSAALDFAAVVGTPTTASAIITNSGGGPLLLNTLGFGGAAASEYTLDAGNGCTAGLSLAVGANCTLVVRFLPTAAGPRDGTLSISHNAPNSPQVVVLRGVATAAPQGRIVLDTFSLAFPDTRLGSSSAKTVTVQNTGDLALDFSAFVPGGAAVADYARSGTCAVGTPLAIGATCTLVITFQPSALGARIASLRIESNASNAPLTIAFSGNGVAVPAPAVSLSPATLAFGTQTVGGLYPKRSVHLSNAGTADLDIASIVVQGGVFANASDAPCPATLQPAQACDIQVVFSPTAAADYSGSLRITSNAAGSPHTVPLSGSGSIGAVAALVWSPVVTQLDFGNVTAGSISAARTVTLLNQGPGGVTLTVMNAVGADGAVFSVSGGTCAIGQPLFQGDSCTIDVRFAPASAGARSATVQVASTGSFPPALALTGVGLGGPSPGLSVSARALSFDDTRVGAQSLPGEIRLTSDGSGVVRVMGLAVSGPYTVQGKSCPSVPFTLMAGNECTLSVTFVPQAEGSATGALQVTTDAAPGSREVALSGRGEAKADLASGGCSIVSGDSATDPTLWTLVLMALAALVWRRRSRAACGRDEDARRGR
jgi:MYXO-CTERM domain-containing protein